METGINLLRSNTALSPQVLLLLSRVRVASALFVGVLISASVFVALAYLGGTIQKDRYEKTITDLRRAISAQARKEVMLTTLKERIPIVVRALESQYNWDAVLTSLGAVVDPKTLTELSLDTSKTFTFTVLIGSLENVSEVSQKLATLTRERKLREPILRTLTVQPDGSYAVTFGFTPQL